MVYREKNKNRGGAVLDGDAEMWLLELEAKQKKKSKDYDEETFRVHPTVLPEEVRGCWRTWFWQSLSGQDLA